MHARLLSILMPVFCLGTVHAGPDSLLRVWNDTRIPDSLRLQAVQTIAWKQVFDLPDSGIAWAERQLVLAERTGDLGAQYAAHSTMAVGNSLKSDHAEAIMHLERCLAIAVRMGDLKRQANTYNNRGNVHNIMGDLPGALEYLQKSLLIDQELGDQEGIAGTLNNMGNIHIELGDVDLALERYRRGAAIYTALGNTKGRALALLNLGNAHMRKGVLDSALMEFNEGIALYRTMGRKLEMGMAFNNLGRIHTMQGDLRLAHQSLDSALTHLQPLGSILPLARTHLNRGHVFIKEHRYADAVRECREGNDLAFANGLLLQRKECLQCLADAYSALGDHRSAYATQQEFIKVGDSLALLHNNKEVTRLEVSLAYRERMLADSVANVRQRYEASAAFDKAIGQEREQRNMLMALGGGVLLLSIGLWSRLRFVRRSRAAIQREKERSEELLHNILPEEVADELKAKGEAEARSIENVTVLFTDFKGFTAMSEKVSPKQLVHDLHECFIAFDLICERNGLEKIKTIGDAYMAAGGLPVPNSTHANDATRAALEMRDFIAEGKARKIAAGLPYFEIRIGIHTGPVVAGIVGLKKFQYDIWGDTVNTASRMESSGAVGQVNISDATYQLLVISSQLFGDGPPTTNDGQPATPEFTFTPRGKVQAKGKGELEMYFVRRGSEAA